MIPWMREKFAERRAKWLARSKRNASAPASTTSTIVVVENVALDCDTSAASEVSGGQSTAPRPYESVAGRLFNSARTFALNGRGGSVGGHTAAATSHSQTEDHHHHHHSCVVSFCNHSTPLQTDASSISSSVSSMRQSMQPAPLTPLMNYNETDVTDTNRESRIPLAYADGGGGNSVCGLSISSNLKARLTSSPDSDARDSDEACSVPHESIIVRVICPSSRILLFKTDISKRLLDLKSEVILELCDDPDSIQLFAADVRHLNPRYRLFRAEYEGAELNEALTIAQLEIRDNESFILTPRRNILAQHLTRTRESPGPTEQIIDVATRLLPTNISRLPLIDINEIFQQSNIQYDVRKVLISLAQVSATIIGAGPYAPRLIVMLKQRLINKRNHLTDTLQCLVDMGFKRDIAEYALKTNNNVYSTTLEWLIQMQSDSASLQQQAAVGLQRSHSSISPSNIIANNESIENTCALLEIVRIYSHRDVPPSEELIESLTDMGFEEAAVVMALKKTGNNKAAACEWLCGNRSGSLTELRDGLAVDSPILKVILELPQVQLNLSNPKTFLAFLAILENEQAIRVWRGDSDTTSVITHILQKYHEEKHVLGINQFYGNR